MAPFNQCSRSWSWDVDPAFAARGPGPSIDALADVIAWLPPVLGQGRTGPGRTHHQLSVRAV